MSDPLETALQTLGPSGMLIGCRRIAPDDASALLDDEVRSITSNRPEARRASGAARIIARSLLVQLGYPASAIPKNEDGAPIWPDGIVGSFAHDDRVAVAALGRSRDFAAIGVDVEAPLALPLETMDLVVSPRERSQLGDDPLTAKILFAAKEATYKAVHPLDRTFLEYQDIEVDLAAGTATTRKGRKLALRTCTSPYVIALAWLPARE